MTAIISWFEMIVAAIPLPLLEVWGRFAYIVGLFLAFCAFGGFIFRIGEHWGFGRARQAWNVKAFLSVPLTFVLIIATGYVGSFIVLVPGAQTFESLKDLVVLLSVVLLGYPALITIPFAYGLSDLIEGVPPDFLLAWLPGYFINPSCFWIANQLIGKNPDFRMARTWRRYLAAAALFMLLEPVLWGYVCAEQFPSGISYHSITPALLFTTSITWAMGPPAFLAALPLARRFGWFWAEIPGHVRERAIGSSEWIWEAGRGETRGKADVVQEGLPIRIFIFAPFIALLLVMVGATAIVALRSADDDALRLATRLHHEMSVNIRMRLDDHLARSPAPMDAGHDDALVALLRSQAVGTNGRAFILDGTGKMIVSSAPDGDPVVGGAVAALARHTGPSGLSAAGTELQFDHVTEKPLSRETWLTYATAYRDDSAGRDWILVTAMPESFYLAGLREANSRSAMVFALALVLSLVLAAALASMVTAPLRRMANATRMLARGDLGVRVPGSKLEELGALAAMFNDMAAQLKQSFDDLVGEVETRKRRERELQESEARLRASEERWRSVFETSTLGIMLIDQDQRLLATNRALQAMTGYTGQELQKLSPVDLVAEEEREGALHRLAELREGERATYEVVTRWRRKDGAPIWVNTFVSTVPGGENSTPVHLATAIDITDRHKAEIDLRRYATYLAEAEKLSHTGFWAWNTATGELFWSQEELRIFGLDPETTQLSHQVLLDLVHPEDRAALGEESLRAVRNKEPFDILFRALLRDGTIRHLHSVGKPQIEDAGGPVEYIGVTMDETERVRANAALHKAQAELERAARLTTLGELSASIAHEISQPLAAVVVSGNAALRWLAHAPPNVEETRSLLTAIVKQGNRASEVIGRIRSLFRQSTPEHAELDINDAIREVLEVTVSILRSREVVIQTSLPAAVPHVLGDRVQLQQVIMNLIMNGADAMSGVADRPRILRIGTQIDGAGSVLVSVKDSGIGIDEAIRDRIFEPLFTTKSTGMGMGLSICRSIVEAHGGKLSATPATPHGTEFRFTIPTAASGRMNG
ncbi:MAG TPA: PAS domain S-box protein [Xanthobacteraceae bacterium]